MHQVQVNDPASDLLGWHAVEIINDIEAGFCYAVTSRPLECTTRDEALEIARDTTMNDYFTNNGRSNQVVLGTTAEGMSALIPQEIDGHLADKR